MSTKAAVVKRKQKIRKKSDRRKARSGKQVNDDLADALADKLAGVGSAAAVAQAAGAGDDEMDEGAALKAGHALQVRNEKLSRAELKKRLKAGLATGSLQRTKGLAKGEIDSNGLKRRPQKTAAGGGSMDTK